MTRPADGLLHPVAIVALAVLVANDHLLKRVWPGLVTGKLSDVAGLIVAPLAIVAGWEVAEWIAGRWGGPSTRVLAIAIAAVAVPFAAMQVWPPATDAYRWGLGIAQWPFRAAGALVGGLPAGGVIPVQATADVGDLLALAALAVTWAIGTRRGRQPR